MCLSIVVRCTLYCLTLRLLQAAFDDRHADDFLFFVGVDDSSYRCSFYFYNSSEDNSCLCSFCLGIAAALAWEAEAVLRMIQINPS